MPLKPFGATFVLVVPGDVRADLLDALGHLHEHRHLRRGLREVVLVEVGQVAGERLVGLVDGGLVDVQIDEARLEVELAAWRRRGSTPRSRSGSCSRARPPRRRRRRRCSGRAG